MSARFTPRFSRTAQLLAVAVLGLGVAATGCADRAEAAELPHVVLSEFAPEAVHHPDGSWSIPIRPRDTQAALAQPGACRGTYINPEIVARGNGTAVHFGTKYFCTSPVSYTITTGVDSYHEDTPTGPVVSHPGGQATGGGVSQNPYVEGFSPPCKNNLNSGWEPYDDSNVNNAPHIGRGNRVTVGCRV
ncbi:MAG: hypothetical protein ACT4RN_16830 [Pseudonocardia sp.]